jgi:hypothetical protein
LTGSTLQHLVLEGHPLDVTTGAARHLLTASLQLLSHIYLILGLIANVMTIALLSDAVGAQLLWALTLSLCCSLRLKTFSNLLLR